MTTATAPPSKPKTANRSRSETWMILVPYAMAILAQLPMLMLYFRELWSRPHYQPFAIAILATIGLALYRWPFNESQPFQRSLASNILLLLGLGVAGLGVAFVQPWFAALSAMLIVSSLLARTLDKETRKTLWPCSLPLYVYLTLPDSMDIRLITKLQQYSAIYTSRLLDLVGLGHHMNGVVIKVPGGKEYGIEQACSGVQSFFTLMLVAVVFIVMTRRLNVPNLLTAIASVIAGIACLALSGVANSFGAAASDIVKLIGAGFLIHAIVGFRATALILSAVFWAVFMNTVRIMLIPLADNPSIGLDLSKGVPHDILGYATLALGILLLISTDQFLYFLFGPVEASSGESGPLGRTITKFWNNIVSGESGEDESEAERRKNRQSRSAITNGGRVFIWTIAGLVVVMGLWQLKDVRSSLAKADDLTVHFFDADVTVDFDRDDIPEFVDSWKQVAYQKQDRSIGSDLGERSDVWQFQSPNCSAVASIDQPFPGWHELTTCYANQGWQLVHREPVQPKEYLGDETDDRWTYIEATFQRNTGEKGYLLFSHFDAFGEGISAPANWGTWTSFWTRAKNRMSHRIRAQLFQGETYQTQVFLTSFNPLEDEIKQEVNLRYLKIREQMRQQFKKKRRKTDDPSPDEPPSL